MVPARNTPRANDRQTIKGVETMSARHSRTLASRLLRGFVMLAAVLAVFSVAFLVSAGRAGASAFTITSSTTFPISLTVFVPCAAGGAGEVVFVSGELHDLYHVTLADNGSFHLDASDNPQGVSGVGLTTGAKYQGTGISRSDVNEASAILPLNVTFVNNFRIIGQGPGNNLLVHDNFHVTVNPDGTVTSFHDNFSVTCQ
jgi:hypothetical protein